MSKSTLDKLELEKKLLALTPPPRDRMTQKMRTLWYFGIEVLIYETTARGICINIAGIEYRSAEKAAATLRAMDTDPDGTECVRWSSVPERKTS